MNESVFIYGLLGVKFGGQKIHLVQDLQGIICLTSVCSECVFNCRVRVSRLWVCTIDYDEVFDNYFVMYLEYRVNEIFVRRVNCVD